MIDCLFNRPYLENYCSQQAISRKVLDRTRSCWYLF